MKRFLISILLIVPALNLYADDRPKIYSLINKQIFLSNAWAGETITLIKENNEYYVIRTIFGSGLPVIGKIKFS